MCKINILPFFGLMVLFACNANDQIKSRQESSGDTVAAKTIVPTKNKTIIFFGNSITAGYGLQLTEAFPALIQRRLDSLKLPYKAVNAGVSGETSADGLARTDWILKQQVDVFVLELGGNDGLRGIPVSETKKNLQMIIEKVRSKNPSAEIILAGMQIPPNMGKRYADEFRNLYPDLARKNNIGLIPFLLEGVAGEAKLNLDDGIHPTAEGHRILAENVWTVLQPLLYVPGEATAPPLVV